MQKTLLFLLAFFARSIVIFHKPKIIGITGTVGKTTVTSHVHAYLQKTLPDKYIWYSKEHYNWEYWLPLTIIGAKTGGKNPLKWIYVFWVAFSRFFRRYPDYLILEYGIDHPWEMDFLLGIAIPDIAILTEIAPNHIEQFWSFDLYKNEKLKLMHVAWVLIIHDSLRNCIDREAIYYGNGAMSEIDASHIQVTPDGTTAQVHFHHQNYDLHVRAIGAFHIVNILPLYALADRLSLPIDKISEYALSAPSEPGRSNIFDWVCNTTIIDGSYNGWYLPIHSWLITMKSLLSSHRLVFLLWDMRELGTQTEFLHQKLAEEILEIFPHHSWDVSFFLVGKYMETYVAPILGQKFETHQFLSSREAGREIKKYLSRDSSQPCILYVKWSQNTIFLEEAIELLLLNPRDTEKLCRQTSDWKRKKEIFFKSLN
jgi:UDP-N-acetylmuramoyl-tripeptide--D-alanyl-D-alanine ligase